MKYFLIISLFLFSCSSSKKIKTELHTVGKLDSVTVAHFDSAHVVKEQINDTREITIEYDPTATNDNDLVFIGVGGIEGLNLPTKGLRRINIRHSTNTTKIDSMKVVDESFAETHSEIKEDQKTETVKKNEVKLPSMGFSIWYIVAGILLPALVGAFIWWKKRKKKRGN